ncbi:MAG TPA: hypothetical protein VFO99_18815, partial [Pyrinomonadaceae bacterium]|nr:hypothetical protein [Pyrinomonadaceae bacterium]
MYVLAFLFFFVFQVYGTPTKIADLKNASVNESSGLAASRSNPGIYWTHNDSGDGPLVYAFDATGESRGVFRVAGAQARDWEDMALGPGPQAGQSYLYLGDIGDNEKSRAEIVVYRVAEPKLAATDKTSSKTNPRTTARADAIRLRYPDGKFDAETLLVHPTTGNLYIITKVMLKNATVYEAAAPLVAGKVISMKRIGEIKVPSLMGGVLTGGSISPDGRRIALCDYLQGYEAVLPPSSRNFNDIWKQTVTGFSLGQREQGEAITYRADGKALLATSEGTRPPLIQV